MGGANQADVDPSPYSFTKIAHRLQDRPAPRRREGDRSDPPGAGAPRQGPVARMQRG